MKKKKRQELMAKAIGYAVGIGSGIVMVNVMRRLEIGFLPAYIGLLAALYVMFFLSTVLHEAGHLAAGLLTGYRFFMFRAGAFVWHRDEAGKIRVGRMKTPGIAGQCLMTPPELADGRMPVALYNMGGVIADAAGALIAAAAAWLTASSSVIWGLWTIFAICCLGSALNNGIPRRGGSVNNDGHNCRLLRKHPECIPVFRSHLLISSDLWKGMELKDMPEERFVLPTDGQMQEHSVYASQGVYCALRLIEQERTEEAVRLIDRLINGGAALLESQRNTLKMEWACIEMLGANRSELVEQLLDQRTQKAIRKMKGSLYTARIGYMYAALVDRNMEKAAVYEKMFEKAAKHFPVRKAVEGERAIMEKARQKAMEYGNEEKIIVKVMGD